MAGSVLALVAGLLAALAPGGTDDAAAPELALAQHRTEFLGSAETVLAATIEAARQAEPVSPDALEPPAIEPPLPPLPDAFVTPQHDGTPAVDVRADGTSVTVESIAYASLIGGAGSLVSDPTGAAATLGVSPWREPTTTPEPQRATTPAVEPRVTSLALPPEAVSATTEAQVLGVALAAGLALHAAFYGLLPGFTRLRRSELMEHPMRERIYALVQANPGVTRRQLQLTLDVPRGTLRHHLAHLRRAGLLAERAGAWTVAGARPDPARAALDHPTRARVFRALGPGVARLSQVATRADVGPSLAAHHLHVLQKAGLAHRDGRGWSAPASGALQHVVP